jgi:hypothetical protein
MNGVKGIVFTGLALSAFVTPSLSVSSVLLDDNRLVIPNYVFQANLLPDSSEYKSNIVSFEDTLVEIDTDVPIDDIKMNYDWIKHVDTSNWL